MKYILCYGDSNTWGCIPRTTGRYDFPKRWPGVMQSFLGEEFHVYENALNGRTTVFEDPIEEGRNGRTNFEVTLMQNAPLDLVIIMLGVNDVKDRFAKEPWDIAWGLDLLVQYVKKSGAGRDGKPPKILLVSPVPLNDQWGGTLHYTVFSQRSIEKCGKLAEVYAVIAEKNGCRFFDAATAAAALGGDGVHMNEENHEKLGRAVARIAGEMLGEANEL